LESGLPPGQRYVRGFIVYAALGIPEFSVEDYRLRVTGLVERELEFTYKDLTERLPRIRYRSDFHCVTKWSVKDVEWEGIPLKWIGEQAGIMAGASWVNFRCLDGYVAPVPLEDALCEKSIIAVRMNGEPIRPENGAPCRVFIPHLYGWKSAKHLSEIEFTDRYEDGFWEAYGYHERGNVWLEERFKSGYSRHVRRRPLL